MIKAYYLVVAGAESQADLMKLNAYQDGVSEYDIVFDHLLVGRDRAMRPLGISVPDGPPQAIINTKQRLQSERRLDDQLVSQIIGFFSNPSDGVTVTADELTRFLNDHIGDFVICIGVR